MADKAQDHKGKPLASWPREGAAGRPAAEPTHPAINFLALGAQSQLDVLCEAARAMPPHLVPTTMRAVAEVANALTSILNMTEEEARRRRVAYASAKVHVAPQGIPPEQVVPAVAAVFRVPQDRITGKRRDKSNALARHVAMHVLRRHTTLSFPAIAKLVGGRDHTTVIAACEKIARLLAAEDETATAAVRDVERCLGVTSS